MNNLINKPNFRLGDRVVTLPGLLPLFGENITGTIVGKAAEHIVDLWIVLADDGEMIPNETYPYKAFTCPGTLLKIKLAPCPTLLRRSEKDDGQHPRSKDPAGHKRGEALRHRDGRRPSGQALPHAHRLSPDTGNRHKPRPRVSQRRRGTRCGCPSHYGRLMK